MAPALALALAAHVKNSLCMNVALQVGKFGVAWVWVSFFTSVCGKWRLPVFLVVSDASRVAVSRACLAGGGTSTKSFNNYLILTYYVLYQFF